MSRLHRILRLSGVVILVCAGLWWLRSPSSGQVAGHPRTEEASSEPNSVAVKLTATFPPPVSAQSSAVAVAPVAPQPTHAAFAEPVPDWESQIENNPSAALARARSAEPKTDAEAQHLKVVEVRALTRLQRIGEARAVASSYYERWPDGPDIAFLQSLTGAHPRR